MIWLKRILLFLLAIIVLALVIGLFLPKTMEGKASVEINKPVEEVFEYIRYLKNQDNYGVWHLSDPEMKKTFSGTDGSVGFKYSWDGKKVGKGTQTIIEIKENQELLTELDFGMGEPAKSYMSTEPNGDGKTKVSWKVVGKSPYPFNVLAIFYDMNKDLQDGLNNLKGVMEK